MGKKAVFLDRDGTMGPKSNVEFPTEFAPFDQLPNIVQRLKKSGFLVLAATNQSCIARKKDFGYDFAAEFASIGLDDWFICPHDTLDGCKCRKPQNGLLLQATQKHTLDMAACYLIGDRASDIQSAHSSGCKGILVLTGRGQEERDCGADCIVSDLAEAVDWILSQETSCDAAYYAGVDIGGTKIAISLADATGTILNSIRLKTPCSIDFSEDFLAICYGLDQLLGQYGMGRRQLTAIALSCPGPLDLLNGRIVSVSTTGWKDIAIQSLFENEFGVPVLLENDANAAAYGEYRAGAGIGCEPMVYLTISTGVGGGICLNGQVLHGAHGFAAELGHVVVEPGGEPCGCGGIGCVQMYSSGTSIAEHMRQRMAAGEPSILAGQIAITAVDVEQAVRQGDPLALAVWDDAMEKLGRLVGALFQVLDASVFVFGGGLSNAWDLMESKILHSAQRYCCRDTSHTLVLKKSLLGWLAGTTGAILLAINKYHKEGDLQ